MDEKRQSKRDPRVDFFRGLALVFIFIDHIPGNAWAQATLRNFGFADASEVFVLLSGYSAGIAYGVAKDHFDFRETAARATRRAGEIYVWHLALLVASAALLLMAARAFNNPEFVDAVAIRDFATNPLGSLAGALSLVYQPNFLNILPLYIVLMLWLPFAILLLRRSVVLALTVSLGIWAVANYGGLNLPLQQRAEGWYFNPVAWQLLFTTGAAAALLARRGASKIGPEIAAPAALYALFAFLVAAPWIPLPWLPDQPLISRDIVGPMNKNDLSLWRYFHVLALACVAAALIPAAAGWLKQPWARALARCGRFSLEIFSLGTLMSFLGWIALAQLGYDRLIVHTVNVAGITILGLTAWRLSQRRKEHQGARDALSGGALAA